MCVSGVCSVAELFVVGFFFMYLREVVVCNV